MSNYLIIGASSGIGEGIAKELIEKGHSVFTTSNSGEMAFQVKKTKNGMPHLKMSSAIFRKYWMVWFIVPEQLTSSHSIE